MKFNFKKISAIGASALLTGMSIAVPIAAANYPAPFVVGGTANVAVVYGTGTGVSSLDLIQAGNIQSNLQASMGIASTGTSGTVTGGDSVMLERSTDKFNLANNMSAFYTKLDEGELSTVLAEGIYTNDVHDDFDYTQQIVLGPDLQLTHFLNSDFNDDKPIIGFDLNSDDLIVNYTLKFTPDDAQGTVSGTWTGITNTYLPILGESYYVLTMTNTTGTNHKITLLNAAVSGELSEGETTTLNTDSDAYEVSIAYIDTTNVKLTINGETTDSLSAAETQKLSDGSYVGIKEVNSQGYAGGISNVAFSIGSGKLVLENTKEVELNSDKLSKIDYAVENSDETVSHKVTSYITTSGTNLDSVNIDWKIDDDTWIASGTELVMPGFESIKLSMGEFITDKAEVTDLKGDSNTFTLKTAVYDGDLDLDLFYLNSSSTGIEGLGKDSTHQLVTDERTGTSAIAVEINLNESLNNYFVVTWISGDDAETYAYKLGDVDEDSNNATVLESISGGSDITIDEVDDYETEGNVKLTLEYAREKWPSKAYVTVNVTAASTGNVYANRIVTAEGMEISLPVINATGAAVGNYQINLDATTHATSWVQMFDEEDKDEAISGGTQFNATYGFSGTDGLEIASLTGVTVKETEDNSDLWRGYVLSDLATMVLHDKPTSGLNELDITYHGTQAYAEVYVTESGAVVTAGTSGTGATTTQLGDVLVKDSEVSSVSTKNLIIVGGSCINSAAAKVLGVSAHTCGAGFTTATGVGSGEFLIKGVSGAYTTGKIALVVAGYEAADTVNAATYLRNQVVDTSKEYKGTTSTSATLVVA